MQANGVNPGTPLLSSLLGLGGVELSAAASSGCGGEFLTALEGQIKQRLIDAGVDPQALTELDTEALLGELTRLLGGGESRDSLAAEADTELEQEEASTDVAQLAWAAVSTLSERLRGSADGLGAATGTAAAASGALPNAWLSELLGAGTGVDADADADATATDPLARLLARVQGLAEQSATATRSRQAVVGTEQDGDPLARLLASLQTAAEQAADGAQVQASQRDALAQWLRQLQQAAGSPGELVAGDTGVRQDSITQAASAASLLERELGAEGEPTPDEMRVAGSSATPAVAWSAERSAAAQRAQVLDMSRLLQPGGEARLAEEVKWAMQATGGTAELKLHPPSLGTLDVRIALDADRANVQFISPHPVVRDVLEAALPRLREALAQEGVTLGQASVSDHPTQGQGSSDHTGQRTAFGSAAEDLDGDLAEDAWVGPTTLESLARRLDYFV